MLPSAEFHDWLAGRLTANRFEITRIPFRDLKNWDFEASTGNLVHASGRFFTLEGLKVKTNYGAVPEWSQPIINQPEIGILGIVVKEIDGVLHCLMSAKMEPGNVNTLQLSPTVQATRSNYTQVHGGSATPYLEYFLQQGRARVLVDVLQSEQGAWFYHKCNRNMVVEIDEDISIGPEFCWLTLGQLLGLMRYDNLVNMDTRTVLSCIPFEAPHVTAGKFPLDDSWSGALTRSLAGSGEAHEMGNLLSWFTEAKTRYSLRVDRIPLNALRGWHRTDTEIAHEEGRYFNVIAVSVIGTNREVSSWTQPLIEPCEPGEVAMLVKRIDGVLHVLMHIRVEPGYLDTIELAPTVQCSPHNYRGVPVAKRPPFLDDILTADPTAVRYSAILSEEGGRFYRAQNRYQIIEVHESFPLTVSPDFRWVTLGQLKELLRHNHYLNIQARSLVTSLYSMWAGAR